MASAHSCSRFRRANSTYDARKPRATSAPMKRSAHWPRASTWQRLDPGACGMATQCHSKAHYLASLLSGIPGIDLAYDGEFFHEFVTICSGREQTILSALDEQGILGGLPVTVNREDGLLWCVTEKVSRETLDQVARTAMEAMQA